MSMARSSVGGIAVLAVVVSAVAIPGASWGAEAYMRLGKSSLSVPACKGTSTAKAFPGDILLGGFSARMENPLTLGGASGGSGKAVLRPIRVVKPVDGCSPALFATLAAGGHFDTVTIAFVAKNKPYLVLTLSLVFVTAIEGLATASHPYQEEVELSYGALKLTVLDMEVCWNQVLNSAESCDASF